MIQEPVQTTSIRSHYDNLSHLYKTFWGDHIHHGYWEGDQSRAAVQVRLIEELVRMAEVGRGARVVDIGCGLGGSAIWLAENLACSVLGLTISPVQVKIASSMAKAAAVGDRVSFTVFDANRVDTLPGRFDLVWAIESTEHLMDKPAFIRAAARMLEPGGKLALCAWLIADRFDSAEHEALARGVCRGMLCPSLASMLEYREWMTAAGFVRIRTRDITRNVERTWDHCARIARRGEVQWILRASDDQTRQFVAAFDMIRRAYMEGAMRYGMLVGGVS